MKTWLSLFKDSVSAWIDDSAPSKGAALAYYTTFSIGPLLFIAISVAGLIFGRDAVQGAVFAQIADLMGANGAEAIREMLANMEEPSTGLWSAAAGVAMLLLGASTVFGQLQAALDDIWDAPAAGKSSGWWTFLRARLLSFGMVFAMGFLIAVSLLFSTVVAALGQWWGPFFGEGIGHAVDLAVSFALLTSVFALIYKYVPRVHIQWRDVWVGAAATSVLFTIGKWALGLYLGKSDVASGFGAFGSLAILLIWVYYSAQIFLFGAEFTWVYAQRFGSRCPPAHAPAAAAANAPTFMPVAPPASTARRRRFAGISVAVAFAAGLALRVALRKTRWRAAKRYMFG